MKTYFLALNKNDFNISQSTWTSNVFDLYSNRFYTNYSTFRSSTGLNELGDFTFVGTKILDSATPTIAGSEKVTDYGEIILDTSAQKIGIFEYDEKQDEYFLFDLESASPYWIWNPDVRFDSFRRFVDTSSRIDIVRI